MIITLVVEAFDGQLLVSSWRCKVYSEKFIHIRNTLGFSPVGSEYGSSADMHIALH